MATLAALTIDLQARTAKFSESLQRAQQRIEQFRQRTEVLSQALQRASAVAQRASLAYGALSGALTLLARRGGQYASTIATVVGQTGLAAERVQELAFAAGQANADLATLQSGLRAFVRRTAEAARGNQSFLSGFERLGFTQRDVMAGLQDIDVFLLRVADRVAELGTTAEQSAVLMTIMGDAGRRLVPFMAQGSAGIQEMAQRARELGLVMSERQINRLSAFNDRMDILGQRFEAAGRELGFMFLPAIETVVGVIEDGIRAFQNMDPVLRSHAVRWTVVVGAVLGAISVLGLFGTALSSAGAALSLFGRVIVFAFSPFFLKAVLVGAAVTLVISEWDRLVEWWQNTKFGQLAGKLFDDIRETWQREDLTLPEKVVTILGLDPDQTALDELIGKIRQWWQDEDVTLAEKALGIVSVAATVAWSLSFLQSFASAVAVRAGLTSAAVAGVAGTGVRWAYSLGRVAAVGTLVWTLLPDETRDEVAELWNDLGRRIREFNAATIENPFIEGIAKWLEDLSGKDWQTGALTVGVSFAGFYAVQAGAVIAGKLGAAIAAALLSAEVAIPLALASLPFAITAWGIFSMEEGARKELLDKIQAVLEDETLKPYLKIKEIILLLEENVWESMRASFIEGLKQHPVLGPAINFADMTINVARLLGAEFRLRWNIFGGRGDEAAPRLEQPLERVRDAAEGAKGAVDDLSSSLQRLEAVTRFPGMASILEAIYRAEGGAAARVPYGMTGFEELGRRFEREINQQRFEQILAATGIEEGSEEFFAAAAAVSVLHYWDTFKAQFPEIGERTFAELAPEMQRLFIEHMGRGFAPPSAHRLNINWVPNVIGILGIPGYQSGTPWTGWGRTDEIAGVVHRREAVIPWDVLREGPGAVLGFLGMPGFQQGRPLDILRGTEAFTTSELVSMAPQQGVIERFVEMIINALESRQIIDQATAEALRRVFGDILDIAGSLNQRARDLWEALGKVDDALADAASKTAKFQEELEALQQNVQQEAEDRERMLLIQRRWDQAIFGFVDALETGSAAMDRFISETLRAIFVPGRGFRGLIDFGLGVLGGFIGSLFAGGGQETEIRPREFASPDPLRAGSLAAALREQEALRAQIPQLEARVREARRALERSSWFERTFNPRLIARREEAVREAEQTLENARRALESFDLLQFLGIDADSIARTIESGFDMADISRLGESLEDTIRTALIRAWVTSEEMVRLQTQFRDLLEEVVREFIEHGELRADALDPIRVVVAAIQERGEAFAEVLRELGLITEEVNGQMSRLVRNLPQGYRVERALFEVAPPRIPALQHGGIITRPTLALVGEAGPEAVVPLDRGFGRSEVHVHFHGPVYGMDDFDRRVEQSMQRANRRLGLRDTGNPVGWRGRR